MAWEGVPQKAMVRVFPPRRRCQRRSLRLPTCCTSSRPQPARAQRIMSRREKLADTLRRKPRSNRAVSTKAQLMLTRRTRLQREVWR